MSVVFDKLLGKPLLHSHVKELDTRYLKLDATNYSSVIFPDATYIGIDQIRARDSGGLKLYDDGGNGIFVEDGGQVGVGTDVVDTASLLQLQSGIFTDVRLTTIKPAVSGKAEIIQSWGVSDNNNRVTIANQSTGNGDFYPSLAFRNTSGTATQFFNIASEMLPALDSGTVPAFNFVGFTRTSTQSFAALVNRPVYSVRNLTTDLLSVGPTGTTIYGFSSTSIPLTVKGSASQSANLQEWQNSAGSVLSSFDNLGKLYISSQTLLASPVAGTIEYANNKFYITNEATQKAIDRTSDVAIATVTVANTTVETTLWTATMAANSLEAGNVFKFHADGIVSNGGSASADDQITIRVKVGGVTKVTLEPTTKALSDDDWHINANATQRTIGSSGSRAIHFHLVIADEDEAFMIGVANIDTTANMDVTVTAQWGSAKAANTINLYQGFMGYRN